MIPRLSTRLRFGKGIYKANGKLYKAYYDLANKQYVFQNRYEEYRVNPEDITDISSLTFGNPVRGAFKYLVSNNLIK